MSSDLPEGWQYLAYSEAVAINPKRLLPKLGEVPFLDMASLPLNGAPVLVTDKRSVASGGARFQAGDTLFARITPCAENGKLGFVSNVVGGTTAQGSTEFIVMGARDDLTSPDYVRWLSRWSYLRGHAIGLMEGTSGRQRIPAWAFDEIEVPIPPLDEQRRIAEVLRSINDAIAAADAVLSGLERSASQIAERAFIDPDAVEFDGQITTFGDLFDIKGGNQPPKSSFIYQPKQGYVRLLQIRDFESDDKAAYISEKSTNVRCEADDVLIARYGASVGRILTGKAGAYNVALTKIVFRGDKIMRRYAYHWLKSEYFQDRIRAVSSRSAQAGFNKDDLFPTKIAVPPLAIQADIAQALDDIEKAKWDNRRGRQQLNEMESALLDDLLSGRVRVPA